ncbi:uncharacterized protein [Argopecten irradians]|uniref:uncharacterized protein n=1 Tax=Argopecten irradians TaxID=31199 RepID=UPI003710B3DE
MKVTAEIHESRAPGSSFKPPASNTRQQSQKKDSKKADKSKVKPSQTENTEHSSRKRKRNTDDGKLDNVLSAIQNLTKVISDGKTDENVNSSKKSRKSVNLEANVNSREDNQNGGQSGVFGREADDFSLFDDESEVQAVSDNDEMEEEIFQLSDIYDKAKFGPAISGKLANNVSHAVRTRADVTALNETYRVPENVDAILPPHTNHAVWNFIGPAAQTSDRTLQDFQRLLAHSMVPFLQLISKFPKIKVPDTDDRQMIKKLLQDGMSLLCNVHYDISVKRRFFMRPSLPYRHLVPLCNADTPITSELFGEGVEKRIKELDDLNRCTQRRGNRYPSYRGGRSYVTKNWQAPWGRGRGFQRGRFGNRRGRRHAQFHQNSPDSQNYTQSQNKSNQ